MIYQNDLTLEVEVIDYADGEITFEERKTRLSTQENIFEIRQTHFTLDGGRLIHDSCDGEQPSFLIHSQALNLYSADSLLLSFSDGIWPEDFSKIYGDHTTNVMVSNRNYDYLQVRIDDEPCFYSSSQWRNFYVCTFYTRDYFIVRSFYKECFGSSPLHFGWDLLVE